MKDIELMPLAGEDIEMVREWRNSPEVSQYMYTENLINKEQQEKWFKKVKEDKSSHYWIIEYNGKKLGLASISGIDHVLQSCYWAFYLGDSSVRGAGIGAKVEYNIIS